MRGLERKERLALAIGLFALTSCTQVERNPDTVSAPASQTEFLTVEQILPQTNPKALGEEELEKPARVIIGKESFETRISAGFYAFYEATLFTFEHPILGKITTQMPFAEVSDPSFPGYDPDYPYEIILRSGGSVSSKMAPAEAQQAFKEVVESGQLLNLLDKNLELYEKIISGSRWVRPHVEAAAFNMPREEFALHQALRELGIYADCSGTVYNALKFAYDQLFGVGSFDELVRQKFPQLSGIEQPAGYFKIEWFADKNLTDELGQPPVFQLRVGDVIILYKNGEPVHSMLVAETNWEEQKIVILQATDESDNQGVHLTQIQILDPSLPLEKQEWLERINQQTEIYRSIRGQPFSARLAKPGSYQVFRLQIW